MEINEKDGGGEKESENDLRIVFPLDFTSMLNNNEKKKIHCKGFPTLINANLLRCGMKNSNTSALASDIRVNIRTMFSVPTSLMLTYFFRYTPNRVRVCK